jgi:hypothetical protein
MTWRSSTTSGDHSTAALAPRCTAPSSGSATRHEPASQGDHRKMVAQLPEQSRTVHQCGTTSKPRSSDTSATESGSQYGTAMDTSVGRPAALRLTVIGGRTHLSAARIGAGDLWPGRRRLIRSG